jgi:hypothetical protein
MRLIYHPDAEAELIESARFYEGRVPSLGGQFLDAVEFSVEAISDAPERSSIIEAGVRRYLIPRLAGSPSHSGFQASQPRSGLLALPAFGVGRGEGEKFSWGLFSYNKTVALNRESVGR